MNRSASQTVVSGLHSQLVLDRRLRVLSEQALKLLPYSGNVLDVGCGNGVISRQIMDARPQLSIQGIDVLKRPSCAIPMDIYDGNHFPFEDNSVDTVMFMDVLHHTDDAMRLMIEAARVSSQSIVIKDHLCNSAIASRILAFMDWIGNRSHGVRLPYNYWSTEQWQQAWKQLGNEPDAWVTDIDLYPWFAKPLFENGLHFLARIPVNS